MSDEEFYERVAELLETTHDCDGFAHHRRTRWNNREAGRGRYPGFGTVRLFGDTVHVALRQPVSMQTSIEGRQAAIDAIVKAISS